MALVPPGAPVPAGERVLRPFNDVFVIMVEAGGRVVLRPMYWQLIHRWEKEFKSRYTCFNVRAESLGKRHNEELLESQRCILPVSAFFENLQEGGRTLKPRQVYEFRFAGGGVIPLGGIYSVWSDPDDPADRRPSCSIITTEPNECVGRIHSRMPFIVPPAQVGAWLDPDFGDLDFLKRLIRPWEEANLVSRPA